LYNNSNYNDNTMLT